VKHASPADLEPVGDLIEQLRALPGLVEKKPGIFYRGSGAFLHFHHDPTGLYVDVRFAPDDEFARLGVTTLTEQRRLLREVRRALGQ
jgi:hypothetical protein